jgi:hypothetical protein
VRRRRAQRRNLMHVLTPVQLEPLVQYANKSTGWILIASGAFLVALKEPAHRRRSTTGLFRFRGGPAARAASSRG